MKIAFFGLGNMGFPIARNLIKAGHQVMTTIHRSVERAEQFVQNGGIVGKSKADAVKDADVIFTILPDDTAIHNFFLEENFANAIKPGAIVIDMTSASADILLEVERVYSPYGIHFLDAPLSGGVIGAENRTMTIICAGEQNIFEECRTLLEEISGKIYYAGALGNAKKIKSLNNLLGAANMVIMSEVILMLEQNDIDPALFYEIITNSSGNSVQFQRNFMKMVERDYQPDFALKLMKKDIELALTLARPKVCPMADLICTRYQQAEPYNAEDCRAIMRLFDESN